MCCRGADGVYPPPRDGDGVLLDEQDEDESAHTLRHIRRFIFEGLNSYDQSELESMGMADFFHPDVQWYGPGGIGACNGLSEFENYHQKHWLHAYPDRAVQNLDALIAEGSYSGGPGWAGVNSVLTCSSAWQTYETGLTNAPLFTRRTKISRRLGLQAYAAHAAIQLAIDQQDGRY